MSATLRRSTITRTTLVMLGDPFPGPTMGICYSIA